MRRFKAAVFGTGFVGRVHLEGIRRLGYVQVYAIGESEVEKAARLGADAGRFKAALPELTELSLALQFARTEGFIPAPETAHAIRAAIDEARKDDGKCIVFNYSGHGHFDMSAYDAHLAGDLEDYEHPEEKIAEALQHLPKVG